MFRDALACRLGAWLCLLLPTSARADVSAYEPPPFTRFPDEPADLQPLRHDEATLTWREVLQELEKTKLRVLAGADAPLDLAAGLELVLPWRIRFAGTVGFLPRSLERAVNHELIDHGV
ncbi:hypothetical protein BH11MYX1_BH11MYX1_29000 [soil metagenome]